MTAHAMRGACEEYIAAGMNDYITKPFQPALLLSKLDRLAEGGVRPPETVCAASRLELPVWTRPTWRSGLGAEAANLAGVVTLYLHDTESRCWEIAACAKRETWAGIARRPICWSAPAAIWARCRPARWPVTWRKFLPQRQSRRTERSVDELRSRWPQSCAVLAAWRDAHTASSKPALRLKPYCGRCCAPARDGVFSMSAVTCGAAHAG